MNTIFVHRDGRTEQVTSIDRSWLGPTAGAYLWVDLASPSIPEQLVLTDTFAFHKLAVDEARVPRPSPKIDAYDGYLFAAIGGADADVSFFVGSCFIVSVHWAESKAVADLIDSVRHGGKQFDEGPFAMFHRLVQAMTAGVKGSVDALAARAEAMELKLLVKSKGDTIGEALQVRRNAFSARQRLSRQADAVQRLAQQQVTGISQEMSFRFRDVYNQLASLVDLVLQAEHRLEGALAASGSRRWI